MGYVEHYVDFTSIVLCPVMMVALDIIANTGNKYMSLPCFLTLNF